MELQRLGEGVDAVVVNPTFMFGPLDARPSSGKLIVDIVKGKLPGLTPGMNNFVDVRDVVRGMMLAAEKGKTGEPRVVVVLRADKDTRYKDVWEVLQSCTRAGYRRWQLRVMTIGKGPPT